MEAVTLRRSDAGYPSPLERLPAPPAVLRLRGRLGDALRVAIVGARHTDAYGAETAEAIAAGLARAGLSVVSGGAQGVDAAAHRGALEAGGHTVAVMGCGLGHAYPAEHRELFERIVAGGGALVSEYDDALPPARRTFPERNRIVAALAQAVVVVRAGEKSGALITAEWARRIGVPVLAVPGEVGNALSVGPLALLRTGARMAASAEDVLAVLGVAAVPAPSPRHPGPPPGSEAAAVYQALLPGARDAAEVARHSGLPTGAALAALLQLELDGLVEQRPGQIFRRRE